MQKMKIEGFDEVQEILSEYREGGALELKKYRAIGTVEECREAREKQRARKLLPCPFCGGTAQVQAINTDDNKGILIWCMCDKCNAKSNSYYASMKYTQGKEKDNYFERIEHAKEEVIKEWNKREKPSLNESKDS